MSPTLMTAGRVVILGGARTPMREYGGAFAALSANALGAIAAPAALERTGVPRSLRTLLGRGSAEWLPGDWRKP
mgnify:CR=1 FL=1